MQFSAKALTKRIHGKALLDSVDLHLIPGQILVIGGKNGAGKSTLCRILAGVEPPDRGSVGFLSDSIDVVGSPIGHRREAIGFAPEQGLAFPHLTPREYIQLISTLRDEPSAFAMVDGIFDLSPFCTRPLANLSVGERKRTILAAALVGKPELLIFDEPANGLNPQGVGALVQCIDQHCTHQGMAIIVSHDPSHFRGLNGYRTTILADGKLREG